MFISDSMTECSLKVQVEVVSEESEKRCVVCREYRVREQLLRFVCVEDKLWWDVHCKMQTRGLSMCANVECLSKCLKQGKFLWKGTMKKLDKDFLARLIQQLQQDVLSKLGLMQRQKGLVVGVEPVLRQIEQGDLKDGFLLSAQDVSERSRKKIVSVLTTQESQIDIYKIPMSQDCLAHALGRDKVGLIGILPWQTKIFNRFKARVEILLFLSSVEMSSYG